MVKYRGRKLPVTDIKSLGLKCIKGFNPELLTKLAAEFGLATQNLNNRDLDVGEAMVR